ncbi:hypothetical protein F4810DRAFT_719159 [Camillea tinctor]|nr:hypothetical protein F4810DRAFT_719159 [Camillea tinctor]
MDPLSASSLAGTIIQFVTFTCTLLRKSSEIYNSETGKPGEVDTLQTVYTKLKSICLEFCTSDSNAILGTTPCIPDSMSTVSAFQGLFEITKQDCDWLLRTVEKNLSTNRPLSRWKSFRSALELMWKRHDIEDLENRLHRTQGTVSLLMSVLNGQRHKAHGTELVKLREESEINGVQQKNKLDRIFFILETMDSRIASHEAMIRSLEPIQPRTNSTIGLDDIGNIHLPMTQVAMTSSVTKQQYIISSLGFDEHLNRRSGIDCIHSKNYKWDFSGNDNYSLMSWTGSEVGLRYISEDVMSLPPGFINLLIHGSRTKFALSNWAKSDEILIIGYRFNLQDTTLRDLQQDLWRQILRDVLWQQSQLIERVCPKRWSDSAFCSMEWSTEELYDALLSISKLQERMPNVRCGPGSKENADSGGSGAGVCAT